MNNQLYVLALSYVFLFSLRCDIKKGIFSIYLSDLIVIFFHAYLTELVLFFFSCKLCIRKDSNIFFNLLASTITTEGYSLIMCLEHPIEMPKYPNTECSLEENVK